MSESLADTRKLDAEALWSAMRRLLDGLFGVLDGDAGMDEGLEILRTSRTRTAWLGKSNRPSLPCALHR